MELNRLTIKEASEKLKNKEITSVELTEACLLEIEKQNPKIKAFITVLRKEALEAAKASDERCKKGEHLSEIDGIPIAIKDNMCMAETKTTAGSKILADFIAPYDATVAKKLKDAGAVIIGKTNLDEFAMGSSTENSAIQKTANPWDSTRVPGGSSGGSAAAVASDQCLIALGTDTGGSIRQPASFCSVTGLKVSYGLVSRYGVMSYASSFDTIGPIAKSVEDVAIILNTIAGNDSMDSTTVKQNLPDYSKLLSKDIRGKKIGIPKEYYGEGLNPEVAKILKETKEKFIELGAIVEEVSLPLTQYAISTYYILVKSEASSNMARYDGIRYGHSILKSENVKTKSDTLDEVYLNSRSEGFGPEVKRSIMMGAHSLSSGYYDAYYKNAAKVRNKIKAEFENIFKEYDVLLTPVSPFPAFKLGEKIDNPLAMYLADVDTAPINVAGVPALSIPAGFTDSGLPVGAQIIGPMFGEEKVLNFGYAFQEATEWHRKKPTISSKQ